MQTTSSEQGTIYVMVMSTVVIVVVLSLTGLALVRVQQSTSELTNTMMDARASALSGVELAMAQIESDPGWRTAAAMAAGSLGTRVLDRATLAMTVVDPIDGNLTNSFDDPVILTVSATIGTVCQSFSAKLTPQYVPLSCLQVGTASGLSSMLNSAVMVGNDRLTCNGSVTAVASCVRIPVEAQGPMTGLTFYESTTTAPARSLPAGDVFSYYKARGTAVQYSHFKKFDKDLLGPAVNTVHPGYSNAEGIYVVDCHNNGVSIQNSRIRGTLVFLNCSELTLSGSINWAPVLPGLPSLLVEGSITASLNGEELSEETVDRNFNPSGESHGGVTNGTKTDSYPCQLKGLIYCSGDCSVSSYLQIDGQLTVGGGLSVSTGTLSVLYNDGFYYAPPPGFRAATVMTLVPGSIAQVVH